MDTKYSLAAFFGSNLAESLAQKIAAVYAPFDSPSFISAIGKSVENKTYTQRIALIADALHMHLPSNFEKAVFILMQILGEENLNQTGMFTHYYWLLPVGKFIETYGLNHYELSITTIAAITKRSTGEYAIRPFIRKYPKQTIRQMRSWAQADNFHLRRLSSEGLRPKLPWAAKLTTFIAEPKPVFEILEILKEDPIKYVQKSVANHLTDYLKVNPDQAIQLIKSWSLSNNIHTQWIVKHATRNFSALINT